MITNSTYDGLLYNTDYIKQTLEVPSIHFDSARVPYTNFHPIYDGKSGMSGERVPGKVSTKPSRRTSCWRLSRRLR